MKVPSVLTQQVQSDVLPGVRAQPLIDPAAGAEGQGLQELGQGVENASDAMARVQARAAYRADAMWATNAATQHKHDLNTGLYGSRADGPAPAHPDPFAANHAAAVAAIAPADDATSVGHSVPAGPSQKAIDALNDDTSGLSPDGVLNTHGQAADEFAHPTLEWGAKRMEEIAAQAPNQRARDLFLKMARPTLEDARVQVEQHASREAQAAAKATLDANAAGMLNSVATNYTDPASVERQLKALEPAVRGMQLSTAQGDEKLAEYRQQAYGTVVNQYIAAKDYQGAQQAFDAHKDDLGFGVRGVQQRDELQRTITTLQTQQVGDTTAKTLVASAKGDGDLYDMSKIATGALDAAQGMTKQQSDALDASLTKWQRIAEESNRSLSGKHFTSALSAFQQNFSLNDIAPDDASWMQKYDPKGWKAILDENDSHQARAHRGHDVETPDQLKTFYEFKDSLRESSPDELAKTTPSSIVSSALKMGLSTKRASQLADTVEALKGKAPSGNGALSRSQNDAIMGAFEDAGLTELRHGVVRVKPDSQLAREKVEEEVLRQQAAVRGASSAKDRNFSLDGEDLKKFVGPMLTPVVTKKGILWDDKAPGILAPGYQSQAVPSHDADQIRSALQSAGQDATPERIQEVYRTHHGSAQPSAPHANSTPVPVGDLAKDPQALSMLDPTARQAVARLAPDFTPARLPGTSLRPPPKPQPAKPAKKSETLAETVEGMHNDPASVATAMDGAN